MVDKVVAGKMCVRAVEEGAVEGRRINNDKGIITL